MTTDNTQQPAWKGMVPQSRTAIMLLVVVAVVAFFLGGMMFGGGDSVESTDGDGQPAAETAEPTKWTCSMHPQIQLPKPGKCPICFMDLIPVESGSGGGDLDPNQIRLSEAAIQLAGIQTSPVVRGYADRSVRMPGKLAYDETRVSYITAWVPGRLDNLFIDYTGATVRQGDRMVEMYSPELIAAQEELLQAKKAVSSVGQSGSRVLKSTAEETVRAAREKLRLLGLSEEQVSTIERKAVTVDHLTLTAPATGVVVHKDALEGMYVATGTRIYTIADLTKLWVMLEAYESDLPWLKIGQTMSFTSPSFPGETFEAVIDFIDPVVDPKSRTVDIRAVVNNRDGRLKPEMFVSGVVQSRLDAAGGIPATNASREVPLLIPASAPLVTGTRAVVYVALPGDEESIFEGREVILGPRAGDFYVVKSGLSEGDRVVTNGAFKIDSELQIQAKPSMMSPDGGPTAPTHDHGGEMQVAKSGPIEESADSKKVTFSEDAQEALTPVYNAYFAVQMALANDNLDSARAGYATLSSTTRGVEMTLFNGPAHVRWMEISNRMMTAAEKGAKAQDISIARNAFYDVSLAAIELHDTFGHAANAPYYLTFCPMARDNKGAYWLQTDNKVWNSFYGASMLRCGEIKKELASGMETAE